MLRLLVWAVAEARAHAAFNTSLATIPVSTPSISVSDIDQSLEKMKISGIYRAYFHRHTTEYIDPEPACWGDLDCLIKGKSVTVDSANGVPGPLELAGVAIRDRGQLCFVSPLIANFVRQYYNHRRFGDLYTRVGDWDKAFNYYDRLNPVDLALRSRVAISTIE